jgi:hypothetical protein
MRRRTDHFYLIRHRLRAVLNSCPGLFVAALIVGLATVSVAILPVQVASAKADKVTTCSSNGPGSLPRAIKKAVPGATITFAVSCPATRPITLRQTIDIDKNLNIDGPGASAMVVSGNGAVQDFCLCNRALIVDVTIAGLTIEDGQAGTDPGVGGGISNGGDLTLTGATITSNAAYGDGGGIFNTWGASLTMVDCTVSDNVSYWDDGGGIENDGGTASIMDSTVSNNWAGGAGGGIANDNAAFGAAYGATLTIANSTVSNNYADWGGGVSNDSFSSLAMTHVTDTGNKAWSAGGGLYTSVSATVNASIVADNSVTGYSSQSDADCYLNGTTIEGLFDLETANSCGFSINLNGSPLGIDPSGLQSNGGPTPTIALEPTSVAVRFVDDAASCSTPDQRGVARPTPCDIGAYEYTLSDLSQTVTFTPPPSDPAVRGSYNVTATASSGLPVTLSDTNSSVCSLTGTEVTFVSAGSCGIAARQGGNAYYVPTIWVLQQFQVAAA